MVVSIRLPQYNESPTRRTRRSTLWRLWARYKKGWIIGVVLFVELVRFLLVFYRGDGRSQQIEEYAETEESGNFGWGEENLGREITGVKRLVIVTCHAIWVGGIDGKNETEWMIEDFQRGEVGTYVRHIKAGVEALSQDAESLLVFTGGETKSAAGPLSEAESYYRLAHTLHLLTPALLPRTTTEIHARDSYQNLVFSIARFHELTNTYPSSITLISHAFKEPRFLHNHLRAISYPEANFEFIGIDPEEGVGDVVLNGEARTRQVWNEDLYGCKSEGELRRKRQGRNPGRRWDGGYSVSCPELRELLTYCPSDGVSGFERELPWSKPA